MRRNVFQVSALVGGAGAQVGAPGGQRHRAVRRHTQGGVTGQHQLHLFFGNRALRHFIQGLQHFQRLPGFGFGPVNLELLETVRNRDLQRRFDGAYMRVHSAAQVAHPGVVGRREGVAKNQGAGFP